jgi:hypothetical protein
MVTVAVGGGAVTVTVGEGISVTAQALRNTGRIRTSRKKLLSDEGCIGIPKMI